MLYTNFESWIYELREHTRLGHAMSMKPADEPANRHLGYSCDLCDDITFTIALQSIRSWFLGAPLEAKLSGGLEDHMSELDLRVNLPVMLSIGFFDHLDVVAKRPQSSVVPSIKPLSLECPCGILRKMCEYHR